MERVWKRLAIGSMCIAAMFMGLIAIGAAATFARHHDSPQIVQHHNHYHSAPVTAEPAPSPLPAVQYAQPVPRDPQIVYVQAAPRPAPTTTVVVRQPEVTPDQTVVIYRPEVPQPQTRVIVVDERIERLNREYEQRQAELLSRPQRIAGLW